MFSFSPSFPVRKTPAVSDYSWSFSNSDLLREERGWAGLLTPCLLPGWGTEGVAVVLPPGQREAPGCSPRVTTEHLLRKPW